MVPTLCVGFQSEPSNDLFWATSATGVNRNDASAVAGWTAQLMEALNHG